jgi:oxygen-dependent protoporphyrinogen oxidase
MSAMSAGSDHVDLYDVVVVGGGAAGLAAVAQLEGRRVLLLEGTDRLGGRMRSIGQPDGSWINLGAHLLTGAPSSIAELVRDSGLDTVAVPGVKSALWFADRLYPHRRAETYPIVLPLSLRERLALVRLGLRIRLLAERWRRDARRASAESWAQYRTRRAAFESERAFAALLDGLPDRVAAIFRTAARRSAGEFDELTVGAATSIFGALWVGGASASVMNLLGGSGRLGDVWQRRLGDQVVLSARVTEIREQPDVVSVDFEVGGRPSTVTARQVVVAVPATVAARLAATAPEPVREQLSGVAYGSFVCVSLVTDDIGPMPWDGVYAICAPELSFDMLFHHSNSMRDVGGQVPGRKSLMCYAGGAPARALLSAPDDEIRDRFLADIEKVLPELRGRVADTVVTKWALGNCFATPGSSLTRVVEWNARAGARTRLAGDYFGALGGTVDAAAASGRWAGRAAAADLDRESSSLEIGARNDG